MELASLLSCQLKSKYILIIVVVFQGKLLNHLINSLNCVLRLLFYHTIVVILKGSPGNFAVFPWQPHILVGNVNTPFFTARVLKKLRVELYASFFPHNSQSFKSPIFSKLCKHKGLSPIKTQTYIYTYIKPCEKLS